MNEPVTVLKTAEETVAQQLLRALLDEIQHLQDPWPKTPEATQKQVLYRLKTQVTDAVQGAVRQIAREGFDSIVVKVESMNIKEDGAKATIAVARGSDLADRVGSRCVLVFADAEKYIGGLDAIQAQADQPELPLETDGGPEPETESAAVEGRSAESPPAAPVNTDTIRSASVLTGKLQDGWQLYREAENTYVCEAPDGVHRAAVWLNAAKSVLAGADLSIGEYFTLPPPVQPAAPETEAA